MSPQLTTWPHRIPARYWHLSRAFRRMPDHVFIMATYVVISIGKVGVHLFLVPYCPSICDWKINLFLLCRQCWQRTQPTAFGPNFQTATRMSPQPCCLERYVNLKFESLLWHGPVQDFESPAADMLVTHISLVSQYVLPARPPRYAPLGIPWMAVAPEHLREP